MKVHVEEDGSPLVRARVERAAVVATSAIAYVEARAAFSRRRHAGGVSASQYRRIVAEFEAGWTRYVRITVADALIHEAARLAELHRLRAYDALHLASARVLSEQPGDAVAFLSWDTALERAAAREGLDTLR